MLAMRQEMPNNPLLKEKLKSVSLYIINYTFPNHRYVPVSEGNDYFVHGENHLSFVREWIRGFHNLFKDIPSLLFMLLEWR
jgi:hypothetical protein